MNIFGLNLDQIDPDEARNALTDHSYDRLPGVHVFLSKKECAAILGVSMKVINQLIEQGKLPLIDIPGDSRSFTDLFGELIETQRETYVLRSELINYIEKSLLCNKPVL